ncbi:MAG: DUF1565 domain-containing protein [Bacillota bacterium]
MKNTYYVSCTTGSDFNDGNKPTPFQTISKAAQIAKSGDRVLVEAGTYREWVDPKNGGDNAQTRISYEAIVDEKNPTAKPIIKGSEIITDWTLHKDTVWKTTVDNAIFGDYNPYDTTIDGDWIVKPADWKVHCGDVYLNGMSFFEGRTLEDILTPVKREYSEYFGNQRKEYLANPENTIYQWFAEVDKTTTTIYANFRAYDPTKECVEINVRRCCFYPKQSGLNYLRVTGFEMAHSASGWAPPTSDQFGMLGANWSKGWIIENNILHDAKCSAISIGKDSTTGDMLSHKTKRKSGYQYQMESVFLGLQCGWSKEKIGSHIVRHNTIFDCGQNGIVGHMGCAFSKIYGNHIYNIGTKHEFFGWEIAGIKFHAPIDTVISENRIHNCTLGFWLDWQVQGTRVSRNLLYNNDRDGNIEVTHGPLLVDNNLFLSTYGFDNHAQGTAFVNNIICGRTYKMKILDRATPYHFPHSTSVAGYAFVYCGDERYYNNIFIGDDKNIDEKSFYGTNGYDENTSSYEEYIEKIAEVKMQDHEKYFEIEQPVYINHNAYFDGAIPFHDEKTNVVDKKFTPKMKVSEEADGVYIEFDLPKEALAIPCQTVSTESLGTLRIVNTVYDDCDGNDIIVDADYFGEVAENRSVVGPFLTAKEGHNRIKVW